LETGEGGAGGHFAAALLFKLRSAGGGAGGIGGFLNFPRRAMGHGINGRKWAGGLARGESFKPQRNTKISKREATRTAGWTNCNQGGRASRKGWEG